MSAPHYGDHTVTMPLVATLPDPLVPSAWRTKCPYCGRACWVVPWPEEKFRAMLSIMPMTFTSACASCAFARGRAQRRMDRERCEKEIAEVFELVKG